jgi:predicted transcriptional regulator
MNSLDRILELLQDAQWHSIDEIKRVISLPSDKLKEVVCFLQKQSFIDKKNGELKITCIGLKFFLL